MAAKKVASFEVSVTPKSKKKIVVEPSPILVLEKFKGTPSLLFKDIKVGNTSIKGLWVQNPNEFGVTVTMVKLPPKERSLSFSDTDFDLKAHTSKRIEVKWSPTCQGSWRDTVHVQVYGLPPPHLSFRLILHLTSMEPKVKQRCCHMNPPLRVRNVRSTSAKSAPNSCTSCCQQKKKVTKSAPVREDADEIKENIVARDTTWVVQAAAPQQTLTPRSPGMDRDSLEESGSLTVVSCKDVGGQEPFIPMEEGGTLPPCSVPSTPVRRATYRIRGGEKPSHESFASFPDTPINTAKFTKELDEQPKNIVQDLKFLQVMAQNQFSPMTEVPDQTNSRKASNKASLVSLIHEGRWSTLHSMPQLSVSTIGEESVVSLDGRSHPRDMRQYLPSDRSEVEEVVGKKTRWCMPSQSSPLCREGAMDTMSSFPPVCSPIHKSPANQASGLFGSIARGCPDIDKTGINHTYTKEVYSEAEEDNGFEQLIEACSIIQRVWRSFLARRKVTEMRARRLETMNRAACIIQKNWRRTLAQRLAEDLRVQKLESMNRAACIIQKNWRRTLAQRLAKNLRAERLESMNRAACIIQKNWRRTLAQRLAEDLRVQKLESMNRAACIIQKNWRRTLAQRLAKNLRAQRLESMNRAACIIQKNWRRTLARRLAEDLRVQRLESMNRAACIIQKNWRRTLAQRLAKNLRAERLESMNRAACIIQKNWRRTLAQRLAEDLRVQKLESMNRAACIIQKNWRRTLAQRLAEDLRAERLESMNRAACIIQKNWRRTLAQRLAEDLRVQKLESMNRAACIIQKNWRRTLAQRLAKNLRAQRLESMNRAACIIQKNWRRTLARRLAEDLRVQRLESMNRAACIIQKNWRRTLAQRLAKNLRAERLESMNRAACIIQKNWRRTLAQRLAEDLRVQKLESMNRAACIIQKNWRRTLAQRLAKNLRAERLESMNRAACIIQKNWRRTLAQRLAKNLRAERLELMSRASVIFQKSWRRVLAIRQVNKLRAEKLEAMNQAAYIIQKNWRCVLAQREAARLRAARTKDSTVLQREFALKVCHKYNLQMPTFDQLHRLASFHLGKDLVPVLRDIERGLQNNALPCMSWSQCDKSTQTIEASAGVAFSKPRVMTVQRRRTLCENKLSAHTCSSSRRCLYKEAISQRGGLSPKRSKAAQKEVPEKERWSSVAEAVGCTPRGK